MAEKRRTEKRTGLKLAALAAGAALLAWDNLRVDTGELTVTLEALPREFDGLRILHMADVHLPHSVRSPDALAALAASLRPDIIALTGDMANRVHDWNKGELCRLARRLAGIAPCYAVSGNHEIKALALKAWRDALADGGVTVLDGRTAFLERNGAALALCGLGEACAPSAYPPAPGRERGTATVTLAHHPEYFSAYERAGYDLVLVGHAHGGQVRLFGQGLFAPGQGALPAYTSGLYRLGKTQMAVSRGLKVGRLPRVFNAPHLPVVTLRA